MSRISHLASRISHLASRFSERISRNMAKLIESYHYDVESIRVVYLRTMCELVYALFNE